MLCYKCVPYHQSKSSYAPASGMESLGKNNKKQSNLKCPFVQFNKWLCLPEMVPTLQGYQALMIQASGGSMLID